MLLVSHTWTSWHLELGCRQTQLSTLLSRGRNGPEVRRLPFGAPEPAYMPASQAHLRRPRKDRLVALAPLPTTPWKGTPAPLWEEKLLFIRRPVSVLTMP